jgi:hypothetical protein
VDAGIKKSDAEKINEMISRTYTVKEIKEIDKLSENKLFFE